MEGLSSWVLQENGNNEILELRGRRKWVQIFIWGSRRGACKRKWREEGAFSPAEVLWRKLAKWAETWVKMGKKSDLSQGDLWAPLSSNLWSLKLQLTGLGWKRRRRQKLSSKNLVSKKYKFDIVLRFQNLVHIWCEMTELPFWPKIWVSGFQTEIGWKRKLNNKIKSFKINQNHNKVKKSKISSQAYAYTQGIPECDWIA